MVAVSWSGNRHMTGCLPACGTGSATVKQIAGIAPLAGTHPARILYSAFIRSRTDSSAGKVQRAGSTE